MEIKDSKKVLFVSEQESRIKIVENLLGMRNLALISEFKHLASFEAIYGEIIKTKSVSFIKNELVNFLKEEGVPEIIIIDYTISRECFGDSQRIWKTIFVSYILLILSGKIENLGGNFFFFYNNENATHFKEMERFPLSLLDEVKGKNDAINMQIDNMKKQPMFFSRKFIIGGSCNSESNENFVNNLAKFIEAINNRKKLAKMFTRPEKKEPSALVNDAVEAAEVIFRLDNKTVLLDNEPVSEDDLKKYYKIKKGWIVIKGHFTNQTQKEVIDKIKKTFDSGLVAKYFKVDFPFAIVLSKNCVVDGTVVPALAKLLVTELHKYEDFSIVVAEDNMTVLQSSSGYSMIKNYIHLM